MISLKELQLSQNITKSNRQIFPSNLVDKKDIFSLLEKTLNNVDQNHSKTELSNILRKNDNEKLRLYSKKVFDTVYKNNEMRDPEVQKWMRLFQTAFLEMEWLFWNIKRMQAWKNWFDHLLWVLNNILLSPSPTINQCIIALLHDSVEEIDWYSLAHIKNIYWSSIANSVNHLTKESYEYSIKKTNIYSMTKKNRVSNYYDDMKNRELDEMEVKFADRLHSLQSMEWVDINYIKKKLKETKMFFLTKNIETKVSNYQYGQLEIEYNKQLWQQSIK